MTIINHSKTHGVLGKRLNFGSLIQVKCCLNKLNKETTKPWHCKIHTGESDRLT